MTGLDYDFYAKVYGGTQIPEGQFDGCALRAQELLNADTLGRALPEAERGGPWADAVRRCCCALAELAHREADGQAAAVVQEKLGSWSRSYLRGAQDTPAARRRAAEERYLADSGLLYRGRRAHA